MLTRGEILIEYAKCLQDPVYAIETYLETKDNTQGGFVQFNLFPRQQEIVQAYEDHTYNLVTKPRQAGISTTTQAYMAVKVALADKNNPEVILIIANKLKLAQKFLRGIKDYIIQMPRWCWGPEYYGTPENEKRDIFEKSNSKTELELPNGCQIIAVATSEDALRGHTPTWLVFDEAAFIDNGADVYAAAMSSVATGGKVILISTPNGQDSLYHKTYDGSKKGENRYHIIEMRWYEDPRYNKDLSWLKVKNPDEKRDLTKDIEYIEELEYEFSMQSYQKRIRDGWKPTSTWYRNMCMALNNDPRKIAQELDVSFLGSGGNVIDDMTIDHHSKVNVRDPIKKFGAESEYWIWEEPIEGHEYILGADISRGDSKDKSTIVIIDFTTMEQVFEYYGFVPPDVMGVIINDWGLKYNAYTVVDVTGGMGAATVLKLEELDYKLLHYDKANVKALGKKGEMMNVKDGDKMPGFNANGVRLPMIACMERNLREDTVKIRSERLVEEMKTFIYTESGRPDHAPGFHDDLLMALGMGLWVLEHSFKKLEKAKEQTKAILDAWGGGVGTTPNEAVNASYNGGFVSKANKGKRTAPRPRFDPRVSANMQDPNGDHMWLFSGMR